MNTVRRLIAIAILIAPTLWAATPPGLINYQGVLRDGAGAPLSGSYDMVFHFYDLDTGGTRLLSDAHTSGAGGQVAVSNGLFTAQLGGGTIVPGMAWNLAEVFRDHAAVWLEIQVGSETLTPRVRVIAAAYAQNAKTLDGNEASAFAAAGHMQPASAGGTGIDASATPAGDLLYTTGTGAWGTLAAGTTGQLLQSTGSGLLWVNPSAVNDGDWTIAGNDEYASVSGRVGIGTTSPLAKLDARTTGPSNLYAVSGQTDYNSYFAAGVIGYGKGANTTGVIGLGANQTAVPYYEGAGGLFAGWNTGVGAAALANTGSANYGLRAETGNSTSSNQAVYGSADSRALPGSTANSNYGGYFMAFAPSAGGNSAATAVWGAGYGYGTGETTGVRGIANSSGSGPVYSIYGAMPSGSGPKYSGYFAGDVQINGALKTGAGDAGSPGNVLQSTGTGFRWVTPDAVNDAFWKILGSNEYSAVSGNVGVGTMFPTAKLEAQATGGYNSYAVSGLTDLNSPSAAGVIGYGNASNTAGVIGLGGNQTSIPPFIGAGGLFTGRYYGIGAQALAATIDPNYGAYLRTGNSTSQNIGAYGEADSRAQSGAAFVNNWGGRFRAYGTPSGGSGVNRGVEGDAYGYGDGQVMGVYGYAEGYGTGTLYSVYGDKPGGPGNGFAGYFAGDVEIDGALKTGAGDAGASGQLLLSTGTGIRWADPSGISDGDWTVSGNDEYSAVPGRVGIGTASPTAKLDVQVVDGSAAYAVSGRTNYNSPTAAGVIGYGVGFSAAGVIGLGGDQLSIRSCNGAGGLFTGKNCGITAQAVGGTSDINYGAELHAQNSTLKNIGVMAVADSSNLPDTTMNTSAGGEFSAYGPSTGGTSTARGISAEATTYGSGDAVGIFGKAGGTGTGDRYSIYGESPAGPGTGRKWAGYFAGDVQINGALKNNAGAPGASGQLLQSTGTGWQWVNQSATSDGDWTITGANLFSGVSGHVSIGATYPFSKLSVAGGVVIGSHYVNELTDEPTDGLIVEGNVAVGTMEPAITESYKFVVNGDSLLGPTRIGTSLSLNGFSSADTDEWPSVVWLRDTTYGWDEGLMKHSSARGIFGRAGFALHFDSGREFGIWTTGYTPVFALNGDRAAWFGGNVGIGMTPSGIYQLQLSGDGAGKLATSTWTVTSDRRLKKDIKPFTDGLSVIEKINPVAFRFNGLGGTPLDHPGIGVVAQEIKEAAPYTVGTFRAKLSAEDALETELYNFNSHALTFVMINAIKELDERTKGLAGDAAKAPVTRELDAAPKSPAGREALPGGGTDPAGATGQAAFLEVSPDVRQGEVLVIVPSNGVALHPCYSPADPMVVGITAADAIDGRAPVAVSGIALVKADASLAPIAKGDLLTTSATPGHAMKASDPRLGTVVGKALDSLETGTGMIRVVVMLR